MNGLLGILLLTMPAALRAQSAGQDLSRVIVTFAERTAPEERLLIARRRGAKVIRELRFIHALALRLDPADTGASGSLLKDDLRVLRIDEDPVVDWLRSEPLEEGFAKARALIRKSPPFPASTEDPFPDFPPPSPVQFIPWGVGRVNAPQAWPREKGAKARVCIIDSGIDTGHPELRGNIVASTNTLEGAEGGVQDYHGHGSHVAGIIAAKDDADGVVGVAPEAKLYIAKVFNKDGRSSYDAVLAGMEWCFQQGAEVANMSIATPKPHEALHAAVRALHNGGVTLVAAPGNSGGAVEYPAAYPEALAVGACDQNSHAAAFSSRGPEIDFIAPGVDIDSTYARGLYSRLTGTSMAVPHVTGLAALAVSSGIKGPAAVHAVLRRAASPLPGVAPEAQGSGLIDASRIVD